MDSHVRIVDFRYFDLHFVDNFLEKLFRYDALQSQGPQDPIYDHTEVRTIALDDTLVLDSVCIPMAKK